jgi:hypothetical protein
MAPAGPSVEVLRKLERRLGHGPFTPDVKADLLAALTAVDDAWEEHVMAVRSWAAGN